MRWLLVLVLLSLLFPQTASAASEASVVITITPELGNQTITDFQITVVTPYEILLTWIPAVEGNGTYIIAAYGREPTSPEDGFIVYDGTGNSTTHWINTEFIGVDIFYHVYTRLSPGEYSYFYAAGSVQGGENVSIMGMGLIGIIPIGIMALSMAWFRVTGKDGWPLMLAAGLAWLALGAFAFSASAEAWDIYQIVGSLSIAMLLLCTVLTFEGVRQPPITTIVVKPPTKSYGERYEEFSKSRGLKTRKKEEELL